tara:strand:+ start:5701 stop:6072 length:372 start_codon:yes stop_codon:yes gene_type:complete
MNREINRFWDNPPGTKNAAYPFDLPIKKNAEEVIVEEDPAICGWGVTAGDNTVTLCKPPYKFPKEYRCPLNRPLEPTRLVDPDLWVYKMVENKNSASLTGFSTVQISLIIIILFMFIGHFVRK